MIPLPIPKLASACAVAFGLVALAGRCASAPPARGAEILIGSWEWVGSLGGIAGSRVTPATQGSTVRYRFERDGSMAIFRNDSLSDQTRFTLGRRAGRGGAPPRSVLHYKVPINVLPPPVDEQFIRFQGRDTLVLGDPCVDCYEHTFVRVVQPLP